VIFILAVFGAFGSILVWAFGRVARWVIAEAGRFQALYDEAVLWLAGHGIALASIWADYFNVGWMLRTLQGVSGRINSMASFWLIVFLYVILGLLEVGAFAGRARAIRDQRIGSLLIEGTRETAVKL